MKLGDIKIVDLKRTEIDEKNSDREHGKLEFIGAKAYIADKVYLDASTRPEDKLKWVSKETQEGRTLKRFKYSLGYDFVTTKDNYYPEGGDLDESGHYVFGDAVLMKKPYVEYLKLIAEAKKKEARQREGARKNLKSQLGKSAIDDTVMQEMLGPEVELQ